MKVRFPFRTEARRALRVAAALAACSLPAASPALAAKATSALADTSRPATFLRETIVTGARFPRQYYQSPQALSFLSSSALREQPPVVIGDVLSRLPGVDMSKDSPWEQRPVLRGLSGQRVLVLMDGMPMNSARGNGPHPSLVDPSQIERVEVVRGPSSVAYGSDALGGAINIITRQPRPSDPSAPQSMAGSITLNGATGENQLGGSVELAPHAGRFDGLVTAGLRHANDFDSPDGAIAHSSFRDWSGSFSGRYTFTDRLHLDAGLQLSRGSDIGVPGLSSPVANYGPGNITQFLFRHYDRDLAHVGVDHRYASSWLESSHLTFYYQAERRNFYSDERIDSSAFDDFGVSPPAPTVKDRRTLQDRYFNLKTWGGQLQMISRRTEQYRFTMGIDAARDVPAGTNFRSRFYELAAARTEPAYRTTQSVPNGHFDNYGAYFQNELYLSPLWTLSTGVRWTAYHDRTDAGLAAPASGPTPAQYFKALSVDNNAACGSVGVVYEPMKDLHLSANIANGYRQPNAQDLFFNGPASVGTVLGNPDLDPERSISYDLGLRYENQREAISGNLFWSTYKDLIDAVDVTPLNAPTGTPRTYKYTNISDARIWGGEVEGEWLFQRDWRARATLAGAVGDITSRAANRTLYHADVDKTPLGGVPPLKGSFGLRWTRPDGRFWAEPSMRYSWRTNRLQLPIAGVGQLTDFKKEWLAVDVMGGMKIDYVHRVTIGVRNVADRRYREALASLPSPGRSFVASFTASF